MKTCDYIWCNTSGGVQGFTPEEIVEWEHSEEYESYQICKEEGDDPVCYWYFFNEHFELYESNETCEGYSSLWHYPEAWEKKAKLERQWQEEHRRNRRI